ARSTSASMLTCSAMAALPPRTKTTFRPCRQLAVSTEPDNVVGEQTTFRPPSIRISDMPDGCAIIAIVVIVGAPILMTVMAKQPSFPLSRVTDRGLYSLLMVGLAVVSVALGVIAADGIRILCR